MKDQKSIKELEQIAQKARTHIIEMVTAAQSGHPGGSLSSVELLVTLYFSVLRHDPAHPEWPERDRFVLSKGHVCPLLYAVLAECGYFPREELLTLRKLGSRLQGHPGKDKRLPGIEISGGSLGSNLSVANGIALGAKLNGQKNRIYCLMGDGEIDEGQIWEAAMAARHFRLDNLCGILDHNGFQIDGPVHKVMNIAPVVDKWKAFGWEVIEINGHDFEDILEAYQQAQETIGKPSLILARTVKGKGVSFMEHVCSWHGKAPTMEQSSAAIKEILGSE